MIEKAERGGVNGLLSQDRRKRILLVVNMKARPRSYTMQTWTDSSFRCVNGNNPGFFGSFGVVDSCTAIADPAPA